MKLHSLLLSAGALCAALLAGCDECKSTVVQVERNNQERGQAEGSAAVGMPDITQFSERRMMKLIIEQRDRMVPTYVYMTNDHTGRLVFVGRALGYGLPYATRVTSPQKLDATYNVRGDGVQVVPQCDPNGLFSPASCDGTWLMMVNPKTKQADVVYIEPRITVSPFPLPCENPESL